MNMNMAILYMLTVVFLLNVVFLLTVQASEQRYDLETVRHVFVSNILVTVGQGSTITVDDVHHYFQRYNIRLTNSSISECQTNNSSIEACLLNKCLDPDDVYTLSGLGEKISETQLTTLSAILLHLLENSDCTETLGNHTLPTIHTRPSSGEAWGYGLLATTVISVCSMGGVLGLPFVHGDTYKKVLIYMVGLAVGTLAGSSLLFLIPEALQLTEQELNEHSYVWKCLVVISSIYIFFNVECILRLITEIKEKRERSKMHIVDARRRNNSVSMDLSTFHLARPVPEYREGDELPNGLPFGQTETPSGMALMDQEFSLTAPSSDDLSSAKLSEKIAEKESLDNDGTNKKKHGHSHHHIEPVAWMIIFGDGIHNFIDGVSIGAAFTESILAGVSVSVAIFCEELPHELGDFAILLKAGMRIKQAVIFNFLSACTCYAGLIVGILLGENTSSHTWVFAFAAGMFLYIALVDMMPEMTSAADRSTEDNKKISLKLVIFLQNMGLISGFGIMLLLAVYGGAMEEAIKGTY